MSSTPPWVSDDGSVQYGAVHRHITTSKWDDFGRYYLECRGITSAYAHRIIEELKGTLSPSVLQSTLDALRRTRTDKDLTGQLGEILSSFLLKSDYEVLLFGITWPTAPFDVRRGVDVSGVCTSTWQVLCVESKATKTGDVRSQVTKARNGMVAADLWSRFELNLDDGQSRRTAVRAVGRALREGKLQGKSMTPDDVERLISEDKFVRVGVVVHDSNKPPFNYDKALSWLEADDLAYRGRAASTSAGRAALRHLPTVFIDLRLEDYTTAVEEWVEFEEWLKDGSF